jgi:alpha-tubulin suppressor-like RCC1 family protein
MLAYRPALAFERLRGTGTVLAALHALACGDDPAPAREMPNVAGDGAMNMAGERGSVGGGGSSGGSSGADAGGVAGEDGGSSGTSGGDELPARQIVTTSTGTCALDTGGAIHCWGATTHGTWMIPTGPFVELYGSSAAVCAVRADRSYECFSQPTPAMPDPFVDNPVVAAREIAVGRGICVLDDNGYLHCELGLGWQGEPLTQTLDHIAMGTEFACGIQAADGAIACWGNPGTEDCESVPAAGQLSPPQGSFTALAANNVAACAVRDDGTLACWGAGAPEDDADAMCGSAVYNFGQSTPPPGKFRMVAMGTFNACGVREDGTVACWGAGTEDECPDTGVDCRQSRSPAGEFAQVAAGTYHGCAMNADRKVTCWGSGTEGRTTPPVEFQ